MSSTDPRIIKYINTYNINNQINKLIKYNFHPHRVILQRRDGCGHTKPKG